MQTVVSAQAIDAGAFMYCVPYQCYTIKMPSLEEAFFLGGHDGLFLLHFTPRVAERDIPEIKTS
jgi:hypothetical protein